MTVITNCCARPEQVIPLFVKVGVTIIVDEIAVFPEFIAAKLEISPVPEAGKPIAVFEFDQLNCVPLIELVNVIFPEFVPLQKVLFVIGLTVGLGFTNTTIGKIGLEQPLKVEVPTTL